MSSKKRALNFDSVERDALRQCVKAHEMILENKKTDTTSNKMKIAAWEDIVPKMKAITGKDRSSGQLKGLWERMKTEARKKVDQHKKQMRLTGGGEHPPSPSDDDYRVGDYVGVIAKQMNNLFDSDAGDNEPQAGATSGISTPRPATLAASSEVYATSRDRNQSSVQEQRGKRPRASTSLISCELLLMEQAAEKHQIEVDILNLKKEVLQLKKKKLEAQLKIMEKKEVENAQIPRTDPALTQNPIQWQLQQL
ncbi:unnamed protein product [Darwinula stevensoni]|uniref:Regulatory protein zeste n=1 Tax=Darwinula stevensoni TaxID=69355 RepID=A0A7R8X2K0_9CRUS|nr:unnamed protein product [Darwinula stevensoni]CAG0883494.1 unnamed protein product [Darwinula stevensoni]